MEIGAAFRELYTDPGFTADLREGWLGWLLDGRGPAGDPPVDLGDDVVELAVGPSTRLPPGRVDGRLRTVDAATADPAALPLPDGAASAVVALFVLHHLPAAAQDAALAEWARVLRPGGVLAGITPNNGPHFRRLDAERRCTPVDPLGLPARLAEAGFAPRVRVWSLVAFTGTLAP
ncbi:hypothetical protein BJF78_27395 [Pseudonocardia sp. CNS-139]|nr:hypothetical protein BJF78_27395 [Pseudonocardia sp. CNS-139]